MSTIKPTGVPPLNLDQLPSLSSSWERPDADRSPVDPEAITVLGKHYIPIQILDGDCESEEFDLQEGEKLFDEKGSPGFFSPCPSPVAGEEERGTWISVSSRSATPEEDDLIPDDSKASSRPVSPGEKERRRIRSEGYAKLNRRDPVEANPQSSGGMQEGEFSSRSEGSLEGDKRPIPRAHAYVELPLAARVSTEETKEDPAAVIPRTDGFACLPDLPPPEQLSVENSVAPSLLVADSLTKESVTPSASEQLVPTSTSKGSSPTLLPEEHGEADVQRKPPPSKLPIRPSFRKPSSPQARESAFKSPKGKAKDGGGGVKKEAEVKKKKGFWK